MTDDNRFRSEILSLSPAPAGWTVRITHIETDTKTNKTRYDEMRTTPLATWALVKRWYVNQEEPETHVEPVFYDGISSMVNETAYRRTHTELNPAPGEPKVTIAIEVGWPE